MDALSNVIVKDHTTKNQEFFTLLLNLFQNRLLTDVIVQIKLKWKTCHPS